MISNGMIKATSFTEAYITSIACAPIKQRVSKISCGFTLADLSKNDSNLVICGMECTKSNYKIWGGPVYSETSSICRSIFHSGLFETNGTHYWAHITTHKGLIKEFPKMEANGIQSLFLEKQMKAFSVSKILQQCPSEQVKLIEDLSFSQTRMASRKYEKEDLVNLTALKLLKKALFRKDGDFEDNRISDKEDHEQDESHYPEDETVKENSRALETSTQDIEDSDSDNNSESKDSENIDAAQMSQLTELLSKLVKTQKVQHHEKITQRFNRHHVKGRRKTPKEAMYDSDTVSRLFKTDPIHKKNKKSLSHRLQEALNTIQEWQAEKSKFDDDFGPNTQKKIKLERNNSIGLKKRDKNMYILNNGDNIKFVKKSVQEPEFDEKIIGSTNDTDKAVDNDFNAQNSTNAEDSNTSSDTDSADTLNLRFKSSDDKQDKEDKEAKKKEEEERKEMEKKAAAEKLKAADWRTI
mmetsp:Transcript_87338/g.189158  ORF Transcript_87338/g.189158 Transcript_87338/m.189158 type:complete len:467 (+) Transcript_87338:568-1968(+)